MRADDLDHAIELQNATPYGLTGGIHSLDEAEVDRWLMGCTSATPTSTVESPAPSCNVNRSADGSGRQWAAARRPVAPTTSPRWSRAQPSSIDGDAAAAVVSRMHGGNWFSRSHDPTGLASESNELRYRPLDGVLVRVGRTLPTERWPLRVALPSCCGTNLIASDASIESETALIDRLTGNEVSVERMRLLTTAGDELRAGCFALGIEIDREPVSISGRRELTTMGARAGDQPDNAPSRPRRPVSHGCSASAIGVLGGPCTKGHSSSAILR